MTALLTGLRIAGFKSFAEPANLDILPGLTGIVGPNGCGKSNVVEALRWAMGESSARSLRGGEMDDVIFAGTAARSSRNLAEVSITLQRGESALPDPFGADAEVQVTRRIERGAGSHYRANGRDMRARDVQTLFADLASGAKSSAMVSQGRVAALVNARPEERRAVLEEAAGITGLHARRHEAELKLRAAEANLARAEELRTQLETGRDGLRKQARQAARYRNISGLVRAAETDFLAVLHARAALASRDAEAAQAEARGQAAAAEQAALVAAAELAAAEAGLPAPRAAEAEARSVLERRRLEAETLSEEAARAERVLQAARASLAVLETDLADARASEFDASAMLARLAGEAAQLDASLAALPAEIAAAQSDVELQAEATRAAEAASDSSAALAAEAAAAARQAVSAVAQAEARVAEAASAVAHARQARASAQAALIDPESLNQAAASATAAEAAWAAAQQALAAAGREREVCVAAAASASAVLAREAERAEQARQRVRDADARLLRLEEALAGIERDLAEARLERIDPARLDEARTALSDARAAADQAAQATDAAELAHSDAGAARLRALAARDQLAAARGRLDTAQSDAAARLKRLGSDGEGLAAALLAAEQASPDDAVIELARGTLMHSQAAWAAAGDRLGQFESARALAEQALADARSAAAGCAASLARMVAEADGLRHALGGEDQDAASLLDEIVVPAGLEIALGALFADAPLVLEAAGAQPPQRCWRDLPALPDSPPPPGCLRLDTAVRAPAALQRALAHAALVPDGADGEALQRELAPGWVLVSAQGAIWRWDGVVSPEGAPSAAASRLRLRARLRDLDQALAAARQDDDAARRQAGEADATAAAARIAEAAARAALKAAEAELVEQRQRLAALQAEADSAAARLATLRPAVARAETDLRMAEAMLADADAALAALPPAELAERDLAAAIAAAETSRQTLNAARAARDDARLAQERASAALRLLEEASSRADSRTAALLPQRERLEADRNEAAAAQADAEAALAALPDLATLAADAERHAAAELAATACLESARRDAAGAEHARAQAVASAARLERASGEADMALASAEAMLAADQARHERDAEALGVAQAALAALPDAESLAAAAASERAGLSAARARWSAAKEHHAALSTAAAAAELRRRAAQVEIAGWTARHEEAARRHAALAARVASAVTEADALAEAPRLLGARAAESGAVLQAAETRHAEAARDLGTAEDRLRAASRAQREADAAQSACREILARGDGTAQTALAALRAVLDRAAERLGPDAALPDIALPDGGGEAEEERARRKLDRLQRERDEMGPVNLRADLELDEIDARITAIGQERDELTTAIARLRGGIGHLNREGRERLAAVFTQVDGHFRTLFTRMMGGGKAHLALTGSDDPLEAGLEIYAEPPGKKLSALSLLSGGEQALTALSLIFAVFRCTPAPVAVLDEVDAPLDDVNVDRFCGLLEDVVRDTGTRFLVVTHHQLTMSRMDRLFGVTMQERGVSRLLSVDLRRAAEMVEPVMHAAE